MEIHTLNIGSPQAFILSSSLYTLCTYHIASNAENWITYEDDKTKNISDFLLRRLLLQNIALE